MTTRAGIKYRRPGAPFWPTSRQLLVGFISTIGQQLTPVSTLLTASRLFGFSENQTRVALSRLVNKGTFERVENLGYRLANQSHPIQQLALSWREIPNVSQRWSLNWYGVLTAEFPRSDRRAARHRNRALRYLGYKIFKNGLAIRPANIKRDLEGAREQLVSFGLEAEASVFEISSLGAQDHKYALELWDSASIEKHYRHLAQEIETSFPRLKNLDIKEALIENHVLGGVVIRHLLLDPLLPDEMCDSKLRNRLIKLLDKYEHHGRKRWVQYLGSVGATNPFARV
ncbi:MAG: hypothetical protein HOI23_00850 [Deltaproteobacteria bacterium]|jgi:phenylacetic acid degradation operon negative regulatory protein|nr:hypothetical protein [Deltaproteobacteria bacterium]MBT6431978.1 hypothetical protein [Deltaproteobacteria bacterium]MBT6491779.1 hypothetical protein [Deltaproteobacteria bacterium]